MGNSFSEFWTQIEFSKQELHPDARPLPSNYKFIQNPIPHCSNASVSIGRRIWMFGGFDSREALNSLLCFEFDTSRWFKVETTGEIPTFRSAHSLCYDSHSNSLFLFGGMLDKDFGISFASLSILEQQFYKISLDDFVWIRLSKNIEQGDASASNFPEPRFFHTMNIDTEHRTILLFGGQSSLHSKKYLNDLWMYSIESDTWTCVDCKGQTPVSTFQHSAVVDHSHTRLIVLGHKALENSLLINEGEESNNRKQKLHTVFIYSLDLKTFEWSNLECTGKIPDCVLGMSLLFDGDYIYCFGGWNEAKFTASLYELNVDSLEWIKLNSFEDTLNDFERSEKKPKKSVQAPDPRSHHSAVMFDGKMVVFGGRDEMRVFNDLWVANIEESKHFDVQYKKEVTLEKRIGDGTYGFVYSGTYKGKKVAIKVLRSQNITSTNKEAWLELKNEAEMLRRLRHPNILQFIGACLKSPNISMINEYAENGNLKTLMKKKSVNMDWEMKMKIAKDIARGMNHLHSQAPPILHRDLKAENILIGNDFRGIVADFGLARVRMHTITIAESAGTPYYMAPEILKEEKSGASTACDVYSFGILMWEILTKKAVYEGNSQPWTSVTRKVLMEDLRPDVPDETEFDEKQKKYVVLMKECWDKEPKKRPSFQEILKRLEECWG